MSFCATWFTDLVEDGTPTVSYFKPNPVADIPHQRSHKPWHHNRGPVKGPWRSGCSETPRTRGLRRCQVNTATGCRGGAVLHNHAQGWQQGALQPFEVRDGLPNSVDAQFQQQVQHVQQGSTMRSIP